MGCTLPSCDVPERAISQIIPDRFIRKNAPSLPEVSEVTLTRHYTNLSQKNTGVDTAFYPLGSCTMKYNPKINETLAALSGFTKLHPYQPEETVQGMLAILYEFGEILKEIAGMKGISLQPAAGAHGEFAGLKIIRAAIRSRGEDRTNVLIPDSAHGTNPASVAFCGLKPVEIKSNKMGDVDLDDLRKKTDHNTAALMLTIPSTLGLFDPGLKDIADILHERGAYLYMDGANLNSIMGIVRPGEVGVDVIHYNLHKTFSTPHGGGGPGSGPIAVTAELEPFLPIPVICKHNGRYRLDYDRPKSIGRIKGFYGNVGVVIKAYVYVRMLGSKGLREVSRAAVLNANYLLARLKQHYRVPYDRFCMHECVLTGEWQLKKYGVRTLDIAKRLLDLGFHPPTIYFPLIVQETLMIEPTETESKETLDAFADAMIQIARECEENPEIVKQSPQKMPVKRLDEVAAAKNPVLRWRRNR